MNRIGDKLVIIHAERNVIIRTKGAKTDEYIENIKKLVEKYLILDKQVIFTRILPQNHEVDYLHKYRSRILWIPKNSILSIQEQADRVKSTVPMGEECNIEFAGGFEFACFGATISAILGEKQTKGHKKIHHTKDIILFKTRDKSDFISGFAKREHIF